MHVLLQGFRIKKTLRRAWLRSAALAIACQLLVPVGYMPGSLANGTPFVLCSVDITMPERAAMALDPVPNDPAAHDPMSHGSMSHGSMPHSPMPNDPMAHTKTPGDAHSDHIGSDAWEHCPLGKLSGAAALAFAVEPVIAPAFADQISIFPAARPRSIALLSALARAPPASAVQLVV